MDNYKYSAKAIDAQLARLELRATKPTDQIVKLEGALIDMVQIRSRDRLDIELEMKLLNERLDGCMKKIEELIQTNLKAKGGL